VKVNVGKVERKIVECRLSHLKARVERKLNAIALEEIN
jgi:hypothetical protein